jgi:oligopeptidase A
MSQPADDTNPLLGTDVLPPYDRVRAEHVGPAVKALLEQADQALERAVSDATPADYDAMSAVLDVATERLGRAWGVVSHLHHVLDTPELRAAYTAALPSITEFHTRLGADERLYAKYKAIAGSAVAATLAPARRKALANAMRDFVLAGAELQGAARQRYAEIQDRHAQLAQTFSEHVLDATDGFHLDVAEERLDGVPDDVKQATRDAAAAQGQAGHRLSLHLPCYLPVMQYARDRDLRRTLYEAYVTRASDLGPRALDNSAVMLELVALRQEEAALLGHGNYAQVSLVPKMAESPQQVIDFLRDLARRARPFAERDLAELREFARSSSGLEALEAWDIAFASERLKEARYAFSEQELKQYFTEPKVLAGLFHIIEAVFGVVIRADSAPVWHDTVRFFRIERDGETLGHFYLDLYARAGKRPGAWMDGLRSRWRRPDGQLQKPLAHLVCNFAAPVGSRPALLTHDDVITLFHEFGHGLHHMLTRVDELAVSGISGVEWDAVELPSQFMENFCWEWEVLRHMTAHVDTGEPLPRALYDRMIAAKNFQSGLATLRQVEFALFDMLLHAQPGNEKRIMALLDEVRSEVAVLRAPPFNRMASTFSHIFAGGYAAGYYSYKWAEVLSADAWSAFEENGTLDAETGRRLRESILEVGGSRSAMDSFKAFRGREPRIDALLRHQGMA